MRIAVTGASGFIGKNLTLRLRELGHADVSGVTRATSTIEMDDVLGIADFVFHLAGVNRPADPNDFDRENRGFTETLCARLTAAGRRAPVVLASSTQAALDNPYGRSKLASEQAVERYGRETKAPYYLLRLTNVFGKWARPNYNSAVATFCHNLARGLPITVHDPKAPLKLLYIDDLVSTLIGLLPPGSTEPGFVETGPIYETTVGDVVTMLESLAESRRTLLLPAVGKGLGRALHATWLSHVPPADFAYTLDVKSDPRGIFMEALKTPEHGQVSYFTALPGVTRGEHYHHTKAEKFLVVSGKARFRFRHIVTGEVHEIIVEGGSGRVVETVPGWAHDITNMGSSEMVVMLWANEVFDPSRPDTVAAKAYS